MQTVTSVSGGRTSAYLAANYPSDHLLFALVRVEDEKCRFPDEAVRRMVEDRIQAPFIGTAEDDKIIYTMLDLEQYLGQKINWVTGETYEYLIKKTRAGRLPNIKERGCTTWLKMVPMAQWWLCNIGEPIMMQLGYRANETGRAETAMGKANAEGYSEIKIPIVCKKTKTRWQKVNKTYAWQTLSFPLIEDGIFKHDIMKYWGSKPVRFADYNNCVGCFHRDPLFLAMMFDKHPNKMQWFANQEIKGRWKKEIKYEDLKKWRSHKQLTFDDLPACASGYCEIN